ncbi:MAG: hypothetical protein ABID40_04935 [Candidatus Bipolaricaulota bacterium]
MDKDGNCVLPLDASAYPRHDWSGAAMRIMRDWHLGEGSLVRIVAVNPHCSPKQRIPGVIGSGGRILYLDETASDAAVIMIEGVEMFRWSPAEVEPFGGRMEKSGCGRKRQPEPGELDELEARVRSLEVERRMSGIRLPDGFSGEQRGEEGGEPDA